MVKTTAKKKTGRGPKFARITPPADGQAITEFGAAGGEIIIDAGIVEQAVGPLGRVRIIVIGEGDAGQARGDGVAAHLGRLGLRVERVLAVQMLVVELHATAVS